MGFDLFGMNPENEIGEYFRNNVWWWRPLWHYVCETCQNVLTEKDCRGGSFNDGHRITKTKALRIARRLSHLIENGETKKYSDRYANELKGMPDEKCKFCNGTGRRDDEYVKGKCNACHGKGMVRPFLTNYPFSVENVESFIKFCLKSGGFRIC